MLKKLFTRGKIKEGEKTRGFLSNLRLEFKNCILLKICWLLFWRWEKCLENWGKFHMNPLRRSKKNSWKKMQQLINRPRYLVVSWSNFLKRQTKLQPITTLKGSSNFIRCQICKAKYHQAMTFPKYGNSKSKCQKCGGLHKIENYGLKCNFYGKMVHDEKQCFKINLKSEIIAINFMEVLVDDKEATLA